ncbi:hypothetical protein ONE63_008882 [Megalurothrips usitatus]|uniref:Major facilitator superfamily (MFS) profile domain-containing protein n=1 Tax=Megalurothrips usitatus TaxID=439358 RepID=A0AAV7XLY4_9NEOP|nr:hypothetical protein ONE63_008882 [Megalurothrips usitatus]
MKGTASFAIDLNNGIAGEKTDKSGQDAPATYETAIVACGFGKFHYLVLLALIPMTAAQLFSSGTTAYVLPNAECDLQLDDVQKGTLNGATYLGNLVCGLIWGGVSDMFGRRKIIMWCFLVDFVISAACSFANSYWQLLVLKILAGAVIAGPNSVLYAYLAEVHDDKHRTMAIMCTGLGFQISQVVQPHISQRSSCAVLAFGLLPLDGMGIPSWRLFFLICALPSAISGLCCLWLPESPKFLMSRGRESEALQVFRNIYVTNTGHKSETYPVPPRVKRLEKPLQPVEGRSSSRLQQAASQFGPLFRKPYLFRIIIIIVIQINIMICINSLRLWTPTIFALIEEYEASPLPAEPAATTVCQMITAVMARHTVADQALNATSDAVAVASDCTAVVSGGVYVRSIVIGCVGTTSFLISGWASKRFGNRPLLLFSYPNAMLMVAGMIWASSSDVLMGLLAVFTPAVSIGLTSLSALTVNLFPTSLRGLSVSLTLTAGRAASLSGNIVLPFLLNVSCEALFIYLAACLAICSVLVWIIPKKVKGEDD